MFTFPLWLDHVIMLTCIQQLVERSPHTLRKIWCLILRNWAKWKLSILPASDILNRCDKSSTLWIHFLPTQQWHTITGQSPRLSVRVDLFCNCNDCTLCQIHLTKDFSITIHMWWKYFYDLVTTSFKWPTIFFHLAVCAILCNDPMVTNRITTR